MAFCQKKSPADVHIPDHTDFRRYKPYELKHQGGDTQFQRERPATRKRRAAAYSSPRRQDKGTPGVPACSHFLTPLA